MVFRPDFETTLEWLTRVLDHLGEVGLKLKPKKCQLSQEDMQFLGEVISAKGIGADPDKCEQVRAWPSPETCTI